MFVRFNYETKGHKYIIELQMIFFKKFFYNGAIELFGINEMKYKYSCQTYSG